MIAKYILSILFFLSSAFACASELGVHNAWARAARGGMATAVYFVIQNNTDTQKELLEVKSSIANISEIHKTTVEHNIAHMVPVDRLVIPANKSVEFKPKGLHIMLVGLHQDLKKGDTFSLKLVFHGLEQKVDVVVR